MIKCKYCNNIPVGILRGVRSRGLEASIECCSPNTPVRVMSFDRSFKSVNSARQKATRLWNYQNKNKGVV
jgi:hypothetical protein